MMRKSILKTVGFFSLPSLEISTDVRNVISPLISLISTCVTLKQPLRTAFGFKLLAPQCRSPKSLFMQDFASEEIMN